MRAARFLLAAAIVALAGCSDGGPARYTVTGTVTYQGQPVEEGQITFEDPAAGQVNSSPLGSGGRYSVELPAGDFRVSVSPPLVEMPGTRDSPGELAPKNVKNIPKKYHVPETSRLSAKVSASAKAFDFDLLP